ncbi:MAG: hypothetical protein FJ206_08900 [Gemmatimonadetes bacterium]|nr:hypothetical protein [Gemmatimonadota bacterium]
MTRSPADAPLPPQQVEELIRIVAKAVRAFQMYLPNNPIYQRSIEGLRSAFLPVWSNVPELVLKVVETDLHWDDHVVYHQPTKSESLAWLLYKDGLRVLTLRPGCEEDELPVFLQTVVRAKLLSVDAGDDLLTLLWEHDFSLIDYRFAEIITDTLAILDPQAIDMGAGPDPLQQAQTQQKVRDELGTIMPGGVDLDEFDSTLYFLDENEINSLKRQVDDEYQADIRTAALAAILDVFELQPSTAVREEVIGLIESVFPNLLNRGEFRTVAWLLREMRLIGSRAAAIDPGVRAKLDSFETRLSEPGLLAQMLQAVDEAVGIAQDDDMAELLKELRVPALEPLLGHLPLVKNERARRILSEAADRIARAHVEDLVKLLRSKGSPGLVGALGVAQRLQLQPTVSPVGELVGHESANVRLAAVEALAAIGTPGAMSLLERAIDDPDRAVRVAAVTTAASRGYKGALKRLEAVVQGKGPMTSSEPRSVPSTKRTRPSRVRPVSLSWPKSSSPRVSSAGRSHRKHGPARPTRSPRSRRPKPAMSWSVPPTTRSSRFATPRPGPFGSGISERRDSGPAPRGRRGVRPLLGPGHSVDPPLGAPSPQTLSGRERHRPESARRVAGHHDGVPGRRAGDRTAAGGRLPLPQRRPAPPRARQLRCLQRRAVDPAGLRHRGLANPRRGRAARVAGVPEHVVESRQPVVRRPICGPHRTDGAGLRSQHRTRAQHRHQRGDRRRPRGEGGGQTDLRAGRGGHQGSGQLGTDGPGEQPEKGQAGGPDDRRPGADQ